MTHASLFSGVGGLDLAAEWAGFETVFQCEYADYPYKVLQKHWPDVPKERDIHNVTADSFYRATGLRTVDVLSGGFPCQPFSVAGNQKGKGDERYLWPEMLRVIRELKPRWIIGENVPGIVRIAGRTVCEDLEREGYAVAVFNFEAAAVGAKHRRSRVFFVAHVMENTDSGGFREQGILCQQSRGTEFVGASKVMADADSERQQAGMFAGNQRKQDAKAQHNGTSLTGYGNGGIGTWQSAEPDVGRMVDGFPGWLDGAITFPPEPDIPRVAVGIKSRVDRLKCLGNAVVPEQAYPIFWAIAEVEKLRKR